VCSARITYVYFLLLNDVDQGFLMKLILSL
jgi:hypothetical protein